VKSVHTLTGPIRVLIADDNELVRRGIAGILAGEKGLEVCGEASDANETLRKADELRPSVILLDVSMPGTNGLNTARLLREKFPELKIVIISQHDPKQLLLRSLEVGAHGCIDKARLAVDLLPSLKNMFKINPL
jgi:two-component system nitrate/nitrite response regulator NarL